MKMKETNWSVSRLVAAAFSRHATGQDEFSKNKTRQQTQRRNNNVTLMINDEKVTSKKIRNRIPKFMDKLKNGTKCGDSNCSSDHRPVLSNPVSKSNILRNDDSEIEFKPSGDTNSIECDLDQADIQALKLLEKRLRVREDQTKSKDQHQPKQESRAYCSSNKEPELSNMKNEEEVNLSFCGCGFLGCYHAGVTSCFCEYAPQLSQHKISGSSAGALVAIAHICGDLSIAYCTTGIINVAIKARSHSLGPFHPLFDIQSSIREGLESALPEDAYLKANGRLHVSLTRVEDCENVIINEFASNEDLIQVLLCSCFIPYWTGLKMPKFKGVEYMDGGLSNNLLELDDKTVTISPFSGEADICPQDETFNLLTVDIANTSFSLSPSNLYRISQALLPPAPEVLGELFEQGFADGMRFLQKMNLISCTRCLEFRSSLLVTSSEHTNDIISINQTDDNELLGNDLFSKKSSSTQQIVIEQRKQKFIETNINSRSSFVSTNSQVHSNFIEQFSVTNSMLNFYDGIEEDEILHHNGFADCGECVLIRQKALHGPMPEQFSDRIKDACDSVNKTLYNWIYSHRPIKYFSYLLVPYYLPIDVTLALIYKYWKGPPIVRSELIDCICQVINLIISIIKPLATRSISSILMGLDSSWIEENAMIIDNEQTKRQPEATQVLHHHHHHVHSPLTLNVQASNLKPNGRKSLSSNSSSSSTNLPMSNLNRELNSLGDVFDSIVDLTSKQEARTAGKLDIRKE